jgi:hypothetical protein
MHKARSLKSGQFLAPSSLTGVSQTYANNTESLVNRTRQNHPNRIFAVNHFPATKPASKTQKSTLGLPKTSERRKPPLHNHPRSFKVFNRQGHTHEAAG